MPTMSAERSPLKRGMDNHVEPVAYPVHSLTPLHRMRDVNVRPNVGGKKAPGTLELHTNGLRFQASRGERLDLPFKNIKLAFFQPAEKEILVGNPPLLPCRTFSSLNPTSSILPVHPCPTFALPPIIKQPHRAA